MNAKLLSSIEIIGESIWLKLLFNNYVSIHVCCAYFPPSTNPDVFHEFYDVIDTHLFNVSNIILVGDFNMPFINWKTPNHVDSTVFTQDFIGFLTLHKLKQYNMIENHMGRILDLVLSRTEHFSISVARPVFSITPEDVFHPSIIINLTKTKKVIYCKPESTDLEIKSYNFKKANFNLLHYLLSITDWNFLNQHTCINKAVDLFYSVLYNVLDMCVPKTVVFKRKFPIWFTKSIMDNVKLKNLFLKKYKKYNCISDLEILKSLRKDIKLDIRQARKDYIYSLEKSLKLNPKKFWSYYRLKHKPHSACHMTYNNSELKTNGEIAEAFRKYFSSVYTNNEDLGNLSDLDLYPNSTDIVRIHSISVSDIEDSVRKLKGSSSPGIDLIPPFIIKANIASLIYPLLILFNLSLNTSIFPELWKKSKIIPVFKKGKRSDIKNYRPIAILSSFAKIFERIIHTKLTLQTNHIISPNQHGFIKKRSTATNLLCLNINITKALKSNKQLDVIYTDFAKAFDTVNFKILLSKLAKLGFCPRLLSWINSYLSERLLYIKYKSTYSNSFHSTSGVPQGSILGPLLFNLFINDISCIFHSSLLFADDLKIFNTITTHLDQISLQTELNNLSQWCQQNQLYLNIDKCFIVTFTRKTHPLIYHYKINNCDLARKDNIKDLGVTYESSFTFNLHIQNIIVKAVKNLGLLKRTTFDFSDCFVLKNLFNTIVRPILEYNCVIWNPVTKSLIISIEKVHKKFLRFINSKTVSTPIHSFPLENRRHVSLFKFFYNIFHNNIDCSLILHEFSLIVPQYYTRSKITFLVPLLSRNYLKQQPLIQFIKLVNSLPNSDIFFDSFSKIKCDLDSYHASFVPRNFSSI